MSNSATYSNPHPHLLRSTGAILAGFVAVFVLSLGTDEVFHELGVYPPWGQSMTDTGPLLLALAYRIVYGIGGGYLVAKLAPRNPMRHALIMGAIGFVLSMAGGIAMWDMGAHWYPIALALSSLPCAWYGATLHINRSANPEDQP
jgi:hypothetical protein